MPTQAEHRTSRPVSLACGVAGFAGGLAICVLNPLIGLLLGALSAAIVVAWWFTGIGGHHGSHGPPAWLPWLLAGFACGAAGYLALAAINQLFGAPGSGSGSAAAN